MSGIGSFLYNALLVTHIIAIVAAFGPPLAITSIMRLARQQGGEQGAKTAGLASFAFNQISTPAAVVTVLAGILLVVVSDGAWSFSQAWISAAFTVVLLLVLIGSFVLAPALAKGAQLIAGSTNGEDPSSAEETGKNKAMIAMGTGFYHLGLLIIVVLMIWKPGV